MLTIGVPFTQHAISQSTLEQLERELEDERVNNDQLRSEMDALRTEAHNLRDALESRLECSRESLRDGEGGREETEKLLGDVQGLEDTVRIKDKIIADLRESVEALKGQLSASHDKANDADRLERLLSEEVKENLHLKQQVDSQEQAIADLEELLDDLRSTAAQ